MRTLPPKIVAEGDLLKFDQSNPTGHAGLGLAFIKLEWGLFEGGRRVAELHEEGSRIREAMAQTDSIADTIAFEVNQSYRQLIAARKGIDLSRPAVEQTLETYRLVVALRPAGRRDSRRAHGCPDGGDSCPAGLFQCNLRLPDNACAAAIRDGSRANLSHDQPAAVTATARHCLSSRMRVAFFCARTLFTTG